MREGQGGSILQIEIGKRSWEERPILHIVLGSQCVIDQVIVGLFPPEKDCTSQLF